MNEVTPETDNLYEKLHNQDSPLVVKAQEMLMLAKKMERQRNQARQEAEKWRDIAIECKWPNHFLPW